MFGNEILRQVYWGKIGSNGLQIVGRLCEIYLDKLEIALNFIKD